MVEEPIRYLNDWKANGADILCIHAEAVKHLHSAVMEIRKAGLKVGVALNPATPVSVLEYVMNDIDMVLVMSVNPGFGGQKFIPSALRKIKEVRQMEERLGASVDVEVDGGVNLDNVDDVLADWCKCNCCRFCCIWWRFRRECEEVPGTLCKCELDFR